MELCIFFYLRNVRTKRQRVETDFGLWSTIKDKLVWRGDDAKKSRRYYVTGTSSNQEEIESEDGEVDNDTEEEEAFNKEASNDDWFLFLQLVCFMLNLMYNLYVNFSCKG